MDHRHIRVLFERAADGTLGPRGGRRLELHLERCEECRDAHRQYEQIRKLEERIAQPSAERGDVSDAVMARLESVTLPKVPEKPSRRTGASSGESSGASSSAEAGDAAPAAGVSGEGELLFATRALGVVAVILAVTVASLLVTPPQAELRPTIVASAPHALTPVSASVLQPSSTVLPGAVLSLRSKAVPCPDTRKGCTELTVVVEGAATAGAHTHVPAVVAQEEPVEVELPVSDRVDVGSLLRGVSLTDPSSRRLGRGI